MLGNPGREASPQPRRKGPALVNLPGLITTIACFSLSGAGIFAASAQDATFGSGDFVNTQFSGFDDEAGATELPDPEGTVANILRLSAPGVFRPAARCSLVCRACYRSPRAKSGRSSALRSTGKSSQTSISAPRRPTACSLENRASGRQACGEPMAALARFVSWTQRTATSRRSLLTSAHWRKRTAVQASAISLMTRKATSSLPLIWRPA